MCVREGGRERGREGRRDIETEGGGKERQREGGAYNFSKKA